MSASPFSVVGKYFAIHGWRGSGPATLHVHHSDDEAWHVLDGDPIFRYADRIETALEADRAPAHQHEIYRRFDSELLE